MSRRRRDGTNFAFLTYTHDSFRITSHFKSHSYLGLQELLPVLCYVSMGDVKKTMHKGNKNRAIVQNFKCPKFGLTKQENRRRRGDEVCLVVWLMNAFRRCDGVPTMLFTNRISFSQLPPPSNVKLTLASQPPLTFAIQVHPSFKFTSVMFKLRTFRYVGGCLQKQERCCHACDSQINPRLYDSRDARERESWTSFRDQHCSDGYATSLNLASETSTKRKLLRQRFSYKKYYGRQNVTFLQNCDKCTCP